MIEARQQIVTVLPKLRRFAISLTGSFQEADDLVHAAIERALSRLDQWEPGTRIDSWMYSIIRTTWLNQRRAVKRHGWVSSADEDFGLHDHGAGARAIEATVSLNEVRQAIGRLPEQSRTVLFLVCVEGLKYKEAAEVLDVPVGTVMSRLARARLMLVEELEDDRIGRAGGRK